MLVCKKIITMKKNIIFILSLAFIAYSCTDMLEENPLGSIPQDDYLTTQDNVDRAIYAIYGVLNENGAYARYWPTIDIGTDDIGTNSSIEDRIAFSEHTLHGELEFFSSSGSWETWWEGINYANYIIYNVKDAEITDDAKNLAIAEAMTMRAFYYFQLVRAWGDLPIIQWYVDDSTKEYTMSLPREKVEQVYKQIIIPDLIYASENAPETQAQRGRATKYLAKTLLAEAYVTFAGWRRDSESGEIYQGDQSYWKEAQKILADYKSWPYQLLDDYSQNWTIDFQDEALLEVGSIGESGKGSYLTRECWSAVDGRSFWGNGATVQPFLYETDPSDLTISELSFDVVAMASYLPTPDLMHAMEAGDERSWGLLTRYDAVSGTYAGQTFLCQPTLTKYVDFDVAVGELGTSYLYADINFVVYRYADAILLFAEAENELNGATSEAIDAVNMIRNRAGLASLSSEQTQSQDALREAIHQERRIEFHGEVKRRFDLIRWNKFITETADYDTKWLYTDNLMSDEVYQNYVDAGGSTTSTTARSYMSVESYTIMNVGKNGTQTNEVSHLLPIATAEMAMYKNWYQNAGY